MPIAFFDLDDTLVDRQAAFRRWAATFVAGLGGANGASGVEGVEGELAWMLQHDDLGRRDRDDWATGIARRYEIAGDPVALRQGWHQEYLDHYRVEDGTVDALRRLREAGWTLGIITNGPVGQEQKIHRNGLPALVDGWAVSDLVGARKPSAAIFEAAAATCGGTLEGAWMVGDSAAADMAGGRAAGIGTIWLRRGRTWAEAVVEPDPWAAQRGLPVDATLLDGWEPDHQVDSIPDAAALLLDLG